MARIREYTQQISAGGTIDSRRAQTGDSFVVPGDVGASLGRVADVLQDTAERQEVSDVQAKLAKARAEWTVHLAERAASTDPGDATFAGKFNEDFSQYLQQIEGQVQTRAGQMAFRKGAAELSAHFVEKAGVYQAAAMGEKAKNDYLVALDSYRNVLLSDPTQFKEIEKSALDALNDPTGMYAKMPVAERKKLEAQTKQELAKSAVQGLIQNGAPDLAKRQLMGGQWDSYLDADHKNALIDTAEVGIRAKDTEAERQRLLAEREKKDRQDATMSKMLARIVDPQANGGALSDREILADPDLTAAQKQHMIDYKVRRARELHAQAQEKSNPGRVRQLLLDIHAAGDDPRKTYNAEGVMEAYRKGEITTPEMTFLRKEVEQLRDGSNNPFQRQVQNARNAAYTAITRSVIGSVQPELAASAAYNFVMDMEQQIAAKRQKNEDPRVLLDPNSKEFLLAPARIASFLKPARDAMEAEAGKIREAGGQQYTVGQIYNFAQGSMEYLGGDPNKPESWKRVVSKPIGR